MLKKAIPAIFLSVFNCLSPALAEDRDSSFALSIGRTDIKGPEFHFQGTAYKMMGGQRLSDYLSLEAGLVYYAEVEDVLGLREAKIEGHAWEVHLLLILPVTDAIEVFGKGGASKWRLRARENVTTVGTFRTEYDGNDPVIGAGFLFNADHDSTIRLEYEITEFGNNDVKIISLGFQHRF